MEPLTETEARFAALASKPTKNAVKAVIKDFSCNAYNYRHGIKAPTNLRLLFGELRARTKNSEDNSAIKKSALREALLAE